MNKTLFATAAALGLAAALPAHAQQAGDTGSYLVRLRALHLDSANKNDGQLHNTLTSLGSSEASIDNKWFPELDLSYFFTPNWAAELILTYPQKQKLSITNVGQIGTFKHLPPTLTAQYHFTSVPSFRPYVGLGVNYTNVSDVKWGSTGQALGLNLKRNSWGWAAQIGADVPVGDGWLVNFDVKKVQIGTDVTSNGTKIGKFHIDPVLVSVGLGYRF